MDKLIEHKQYINKHGRDLPEIRNYKWSKNQWIREHDASEIDLPLTQYLPNGKEADIFRSLLINQQMFKEIL